MSNLIERLKKANNGDVLLDAEIARLVGWKNFDKYTDGGERELNFLLSHKHPPAREEIARRMRLPRYTFAVDDALSLLPDDSTNEITGKADWQLESTNGGLTISARVGSDPDDRVFADTPALAMCAACLAVRKKWERE